jgi:hypothetical protein
MRFMGRGKANMDQALGDAPAAVLGEDRECEVACPFAVDGELEGMIMPCGERRGIHRGLSTFLEAFKEPRVD